MRWYNIDKYDRVTILWIYGLREGASAPETVYANGIVIHVPQSTGDMFHIELDDGRISAINPQCCWLVSITRQVPFEERQED